jgi:broad specificity phosphatase PhoE
VRAVEGRVALVAHGHILRALAACWIDAPVDLGGRLHLGTGTVSVLAYEREVAVISHWNT